MTGNHGTQTTDVCRSQALLSEAEELANLGSWEHDVEAGTVFQSANLRRMLGAEPRVTTVPQDDIWQFTDPEDHEPIRQIIARAMQTREPYEFQSRMILPDGRRRVFLVRGKPIVDSENRVVRRIGVAMDVTERMEFIDAIRESAQMYRDLVENSHSLICTHDLTGKLLSMNELPAKILGYGPEELVGRRIPDLLPANGEALYAEYLARLQRDGHATGLLALPTRSGERRIWEYYNTLRTAGLPDPVVRGTAHDITERFEAEKKLRKSEALLAQAEELANVGSWEFDVLERTLHSSAQFYRMLGLTPKSDVLPMERGLAMIHPDDREKALRNIESLTSGAQEYENELRFLAADGRERVFHSRAVAVRGNSGRVVKIRGMSQDVTERKSEEQRLRKSETLLAQAERLANVGSWELDVQTQALNWSAQFFRILGLDPEQGPVRYGTGIAMIHPDDRERALRDAASLTAGGQEFENELRFQLPDRRERILHSRAMAVADKTGRVTTIRGMSQDITDRKREEHLLRKSEALLSQAEQMANCGSWEVNVRTRRATFSKHLRLMCGLRPEEEIGPNTYWARIHPDDRERAIETIGKAIAEIKPFEHVSRYLPPEGGVRYHYAHGIPVAGPDGKAEISMGVVQDITDRVRAEQDLHNLLRKLLTVRDEDRRRLARQLHESVGQTLGALTMSMGRLRESLPGHATLSHALWRSCNDLARQAARETREISYSMHPHMLDEAGLGSALRCYARDFADMSGIDVNVDVPEGFARQPREIETTVFRIVQEALTNIHRHSGSRTASVQLNCDNQQLRAEVTDEGCGLPAAPSSFRPSQQGVGITGMRERAEQLHGMFEVESSPGHGTTIRVILPLTAARQVSAG